MTVIGLDIGTTSISLVAYAQPGGVLRAVTLPNQTFLPNGPAWERAQDPDAILAIAEPAVHELLARYPDAACIGVTGQMHGIVYLDADGRACSPLYTWQDGRGDLPLPDGSGDTYAARLRALTGFPMATGFGLTTHFYNVQNGLVPPQAVRLCTIHDYVAMRLAGRVRPVMDPSDAASLGLYDLAANAFDPAALEKAGLDGTLLPEIGSGLLDGPNPLGVPVCAGIGDNQASFLGAADGALDRALINLGTGGQFSAYTPALLRVPGLETRPFPGGGYLLVGASLCGGRAYALWEQFLRRVAETVTGQTLPPCYDAMARLLESPMPADCPTVSTLFNGTRENPALRGAITGLSADNLTPLHLTYGLMRGMLGELYDMYLSYARVCPAPAGLVGSGNGLRKNPRLQQMAAELFALPFTLSSNAEEAACGAAIQALRAMNA